MANANPIRYRGYYFDDDTNLYCLNTRYYSPLWRRFVSRDDTAHLTPEAVNGLNLYCYCDNDPVNVFNKAPYQLFSGGKGEASMPSLSLNNTSKMGPGMPDWAKLLVFSLAVTGLTLATVMTFGAAGTIVGTVGASMLAGGLIAGATSAACQVYETGQIDWTRVAISTLSGTAYGAVNGIPGGAFTVGRFLSNIIISSTTTALITWNARGTREQIALSALSSATTSATVQFTLNIGVPFAKDLIRKSVYPYLPKTQSHSSALGDVISVVCSNPIVKTAATKFGLEFWSYFKDDIF